jgi:LysR family nitrogen assimilation transcriptional regulator
MLEWLNVGRVDCALVYNAAPAATLDVQPLLDEQLFLIAPMTDTKPARRQTINLADLARYPLIIPSRPHAMRMSVENALAGVDCKISVAHEIESIPAVIDLVRQGHGHAVLPANAVHSTPWASDVRVIPILNPLLKTSLSIATSAQRPRSPLLCKAIEVIRGAVRQAIRNHHPLYDASKTRKQQHVQAQ